MKNYQFLQQKYIVNTYVNRGVTFVKGQGIYLYDETGNRYLDMMSNYGVSIFGHANKEITEQLEQQLKLITTLHGSFNNDKRAEASELLIKRCGPLYQYVYWSNSGAEANEAALKFAVAVTGKKKIIACDHGYHGKTLGALSVTYGEKYRKPFLPLLWQVEFIPYDNPEALEKAIDKNTAAFIVEPIQGEGGIYVPDKNYLKKVRQICDKHGVILIIDEVQTGMGRAGSFLCSQKSGIEADILTLGKGLAGGIPVGATLINNKVSAVIFKGLHTSTFGGNPLASAGIIATLNKIDNKILKHVTEMGSYFIKELKKIKSSSISDVRGQGLMIGLDVKIDRNNLLKKLQGEKILAIPAGDTIVRFLPPFVIEIKHIDLVIEKLIKIFENF
ncbi:aspartate aminotransferase family protein [Candidatus Roizmanbacteria bacterium CG02_land_8_20_14_3_00_36_15]|uniref:Aspartate aminotransferase family protein n=1 Tax=Candidatus Roizmanbacteria bacterium CG_4_9_14_0_2_um_filter_35_15 TaxID=1974836 RepID=A0A2M8F4R9_9BACT|nr:MAG: aspartate aminotransferase family protein [Candidatus Roizmanbacteria bacterium CG03_land_8_20_14_0_80_36_21]PIV37365.1 MAG: aspartate aminotransferase family protein [Candidatus Roizmanbacteria bacterium CG02_land_8_20_14_3_00_36_15]PJA52867.1 MAG: aspartate aminotransferase family protein [Candidatus Roizmanbacteria bacterium CG_4_9_14_3_um_filter_36_11]PJC34295.1 MAG: aspartate aminotransferase family protein [Candidatus Roizmanbacteria bacterium CG_4_9_14_0_2_um_filter_35_15]PJC8236